VPIVQKASAFVPELLFQVAKRAFLGVRYRGVRVETAPNGEPPAQLAPLFNQSITVTSSGIGAVVFAGSGKVAPSFGDMGGEPDLPSIGAGLRWLASEKARVNLSIDVAKGRDGSAAYVYVKEAF